ncbi:hypothetical protein VNI00_016806 [Paramarasmius palmivorus]|uniref:Uncharacterized protein n=1 Tax=Paramarasmius palmivorus TaxID=297713 RepID=A0AAW0BC55_9AGAR
MPETVIWDGVTLAFSRKHLKGCLKPPTDLEPGSLSRPRKYIKDPQWFSLKKPLRKAFIAWLRGGSRRVGLVTAEEWLGTEEAAGEVGENSHTMQKDLFTQVTESLGTVAPAVAKVLTYALGPRNQLDRSLLKRYTTLFEQLAAEESLIQMVNESALEKLEAFIHQPSLENATRLIDIPALLLVLEGEMRRRGSVPWELYDLCRWMVARTRAVFGELKKGSLELLEKLQPGTIEEDWKKVCSLD